MTDLIAIATHTLSARRCTWETCSSCLHWHFTHASYSTGALCYSVTSSHSAKYWRLTTPSKSSLATQPSREWLGYSDAWGKGVAPPPSEASKVVLSAYPPPSCMPQGARCCHSETAPQRPNREWRLTHSKHCL